VSGLGMKKKDKKQTKNLSFTQLQNRTFHAMERTKTAARCKKNLNARAKRAKLPLQICDFLGAAALIGC